MYLGPRGMPKLVFFILYICDGWLIPIAIGEENDTYGLHTDLKRKISLILFCLFYMYTYVYEIRIHQEVCFTIVH